jgi:hypothetical protein
MMEVVAMSLTELFPVLHELPRADKLRAIQFLVAELAKEEGVTLLEPGAAYPIWTPYQAFEAADNLLRTLKEGPEENSG